jgi:hypothetical protein
MIHWAHAFRVAARPSLDLSLLHAANTRKSFYTATVKGQPYSTTGLMGCKLPLLLPFNAALGLLKSSLALHFPSWVLPWA